MATRNRTDLFKQHRSSYRDRTQRPFQEEYEMEKKPPHWTPLCHDVEDMMKNLKVKIRDLSQLQKKDLVDFDDFDNEEEIKILTEDISEVISICLVLFEKENLLFMFLFLFLYCILIYFIHFF